MAILRYSDLATEADPAAAARSFLLQGRALLAGLTSSPDAPAPPT